MNRQANKCHHCHRSFTPRKIDQKYCSHRCRQAAYRKRKLKLERGFGPQYPLKTDTSIHLLCKNCGGMFLAKRNRAEFCSTSCRSLYHRALKAAIPEALATAFQLPMERALDVAETQSIGKMRRLLTEAGYFYQHQQRRWMEQPEFC